MAHTPEFNPIQLPDVRTVVPARELSQMLEAFSPFDERMVEGTQARLNKDNAKLEAMAKETERLTKALALQVSARRTMNAQLQKLSEVAIAQSYQEFASLVADKTQIVEERLDALNERLTALDDHFAMEKARIEAEIEERHGELMDMLSHFEERFREECAVRSEREAHIRQEMNLHEADIDERFTLETAARDSVISRLRHELSANIASRRASDVQFAAFVKRELASVKAQLDEECAAREREDDAAEASLAQFTTELQRSLHVVNSAD